MSYPIQKNTSRSCFYLAYSSTSVYSLHLNDLSGYRARTAGFHCEPAALLRSYSIVRQNSIRAEPIQLDVDKRVQSCCTGGLRDVVAFAGNRHGEMPSFSE